MNTKISEAEPATYGIRVKGNSTIVGILPVPLKDFPVKNPEWDERYEEVPLYLHPQPAELAEQQGVDPVRKLLDEWRSTPDFTGITGTFARELEAALAARQPGAQGPVFEVVEGPGEHRPRVTKQLSELPPVGSLLYAAPPAQGIDMGQFRDAVLCWRGVQWNRSCDDCETDSPALAKVKEADRLLALIDQRDAAPGAQP